MDSASSFPDLSEDSELMKGLKEMGLVLEDDESNKKKKPPPPPPKKANPIKESSSDMNIDDFLDEIASPRERSSSPTNNTGKQTQSKPKRKRSAGRRPAQMRPIRVDYVEIEPAKSRLTFDYLLDDPPPKQEQETPSATVFIPPPPPPTELMLEKRVMDYLHYSMRDMTNDVLTELEEMLRDEGDVNAIVNTFVTDLQKQIRENLLFETETIDYAKRSLANFDTFAPGFIDVITKIHKLQNTNGVANLNSIRSSRASIMSRLSLMQESFATSLDTLSQEISDVNSVRTQAYAARTGIDRKATMVMQRYADIEAKEIMQNVERELLENNRSRLEHDTIDTREEIPVYQINRKLKDLLRSMRELVLSEPNPAQVVKRTALHIFELTEHMATMRQAYAYQHRQLCDFYSMLSSYSKLQPRESAVDRESVVQEFPIENTKTITELTSSSVHSRLAQVRKEQSDVLKDVSSFLDKASHSRSRHNRRRAHV